MTLSSKIALAFSALVAIAGSLAIAIVIEEQARVRRAEFRRDAVEMLELLALSTAPSVASGRHDRVQAVLDNVANYPDRMPDVETLDVVGRDGRVIADLDPRRFNEPAPDARADLGRAEPFTRELPPDHLRVVVPIRLAYPLGVVRATLAETHLDKEVAAQQRRAAAMLAVTLIVLAAGLYVVHRRLVGTRIAKLAATARKLERGSLGSRAAMAGTDEVAQLGAQLDRMAGEIQSYTGDLEKLVAERTAALEAANHKLEQMAITDPLTGLFNRRHFEERVLRDLEIARRAGRPFALVMCDVDHFKRINDRFGHPVGDVVLRDVAQLLAENARAADLVARFGGEEFMVAMPDTTPEQAMAAAERMRELLEVATHPGAPQLGGEKITASFGVASFPEHGGTMHALLDAADSALYRAKDGGRNRVERPGGAAA